MNGYALMVNSGKAEAAERLFAVAPDIELDVITERSYAAMYQPDIRLHFVDDIGDPGRVRATMLDLLSQQPVDYVISPSERSMQTGGYLRSFLGLSGIDFGTAVRFSNKAVMKSVLTAAGIAVARYRVIGGLARVPAAASEVGWPVVLKPALGTGSMNTFRVENPQDLASLIASPRADGLRGVDCPLLVEQFVDMEAEYHCDGIVHDGEVKFAAVSRYFEPLLGGIDSLTGSYILPSSEPDSVAVQRLHETVVTTLGLNSGVTHMELFKTDAGFLVGEIACRPAGGGIPRGIELQFGVNLWNAFMRTSLGLAPSPGLPAGSQRPGMVANCDFPIRPGRVTRISTSRDLASVPGVTDLRMSVRPGDVIGKRLHSSSTTGLAFFEGADEKELMKITAELAQRYILETEPVAG